MVVVGHRLIAQLLVGASSFVKLSWSTSSSFTAKLNWRPFSKCSCVPASVLLSDNVGSSNPELPAEC